MGEMMFSDDDDRSYDIDGISVSAEVFEIVVKMGRQDIDTIAELEQKLSDAMSEIEDLKGEIMCMGERDD